MSLTTLSGYKYLGRMCKVSLVRNMVDDAMGYKYMNNLSVVWQGRELIPLVGDFVCLTVW